MLGGRCGVRSIFFKKHCAPVYTVLAMTEVPDSARNRAWCFTINNWVEDDWKRCEALCVDRAGSEACRYMVMCAEVGDEKDTPHIQGYVEFKNGRLAGALKKYFGGRAHLEPRRGTSKQAADYCKKTWGDDPEPRHFEFGLSSHQGRRTDLDMLGEAVIDGATDYEITDDAPGMFVRYHKGIQALRLARMIDRDPDVPPTVIWRWGMAGAGKTRYIGREHKSTFVKDSHLWWDGYLQQEAIIIDDFNPLKWDFRDLLRLLDRYPYRGQIKGAYVPINSPFIYITCEFHPRHFWTGNEYAQVWRRLTKIVEVQAPETVTDVSAQKSKDCTEVYSVSGEYTRSKRS